MNKLHLLFVLLIMAFTHLIFSPPAHSFIYVKDHGKRSTPASLVVKFHDRNTVKLAVNNDGPIGIDGFTGNGAGFWPGNTSNNYVFGTGIWIGGLADTDADGVWDTVCVMSYNPLDGGSEFDEGRYGQSPDDPLASVFRSTDSEDLENWPEEFWGTDKDPESATYNQLIPVVMSDQDIVTIYNSVDAIPKYGENAPFEVRQRSLAFVNGAARQVIFFFFDIENLSERVPEGPFSIEEAWIGFESDFDIGNSFRDDRTSFFRWQVTPEGDSIPINMGFAWDNDFDEGANWIGKVGFVGVAFLQGPGNDYDGIDNDSDGMIDESPFNNIDDDGDGLIDDMPDEVDRLGLVNYTFHCGPSTCESRPDPQSDPEAYRMLKCDPPDECFETTEDTDIRYLISSGPFRIRPGETHRFVLAFVFADPVGDPSSINVYGDPPRPDPNDPAFGEFLQVKHTVQGLYDLNFVRATPPPRPVMTLVPGDMQVAVLWDDSPLYAADEKYDEFVQIDLAYRQLDFEGFRLWRSRTGKFSTAGDPDDPLEAIDQAINEENPEYDITLLGQWDLQDGITTLSHGIVVTDSVIDQAGKVVVISADTFDLGEDTGLRFSFIDRGEPDSPLINGINYYYCLESYDYNSANIPTSSVSLRNGVEFSPENTCMPRTNATGFMPASVAIAHVDEEGNPLADETPEIFVYEEPPLATDALVGFTFSPSVDEKIEDTFHEFVIDEIIPSYQELTSEVKYHVEDASGRHLYTGGEAQYFFTMDYDSTTTEVIATVFNPSDTTIPLYEFSLDFFADYQAYQVPSEASLTAQDREGNDVTDSLGSLMIPIGPFEPLGFRGTDIQITWQRTGSDTMTLSVYDTGNKVLIPFREDEQDPGPAWTFVPFGDQPGGMYLIGEPQVFILYVSGVTISIVEPQRLPRDGDVWLLRQRSFYVSQEGDTIPASRPPVPGTRYRLNLTSGGQDVGKFDLNKVRVVPNPYIGYSEFEFGSGTRKIQFVNLPAECTIRIYTISGVLVRVLEHTPDEAGTENYDLKTREGLKLASGNYYYHITTPDGHSHIGRFAIVQ